jgi:hypothetical protein
MSDRVASLSCLGVSHLKMRSQCKTPDCRTRNSFVSLRVPLYILSQATVSQNDLCISLVFKYSVISDQSSLILLRAKGNRVQGRIIVQKNSSTVLSTLLSLIELYLQRLCRSSSCRRFRIMASPFPPFHPQDSAHCSCSG